MLRLSATPLDPRELAAKLQDQRTGALVTFEGRVRDLNQGRDVVRLEYEGTEPLAKKEFEKIVAEARAQFEFTDAFCSHRVGILGPGDIAVWIGVTSVHRSAAFAASKYLIDELKKRLPIWKKEHYADGASEWINSP